MASNPTGNPITGIVQTVERIGTGSRVCLDFADILTPTEGVFVGNTGDGYVFVLSENRSTETYPPRPFRVNAGAVHQYIFQDGDTKYLSEMEAGQSLFVYDGEQTKHLPLGRVKVEKRELLRVVIEAEGKLISATLQDSDSVSLLTSSAEPVPATEVKAGMEIICLIDHPGRHLGKKISEEIFEK
ncbi:3-dehydroquinate synthase II [Alteribacillus sp. HJP-4]|uniref:3-dehydroquinate synthase II n=1 Tax=Alteribacillus sp. HJP-4 TaxID=2775394 RepID=UPI0035CCE476